MKTATLLVGSWALALLCLDVTRRKLPDVLTLGGCGLALGMLLATGHALLGADWRAVLLGAGLGLALTLPAYLARWLGAGDVKLALAMGLLGGFTLLSASFVIAGLLAGIVALAWLALQWKNRQSAWSLRRIPFGAALSAGLLLVLGFQP